MAKAKTEAEYQEWVKEVAAKVPDEQKAAFDSFMTGSIGMELFGGHLRQSEFHRRLTEVHTEKQALEAQRASFAQDVSSMDEWFQAESPKNQRLVAERDKLRAEAESMRERLVELGLEEAAPKVKPARVADEPDVRREIQALQQRIAMMDQALPAMLADYGTVMKSALKDDLEFDPKQLIALSMEKSVPLPQAMEMLTAKERGERAQKANEAAIEKAREEGRREALSQRGSPDYMKRSGPTVLDAIKEGKPSNSQDRVDASVQMYYDTAGA